MGYYTNYELNTDDDGMTECPTCNTFVQMNHKKQIAKMLDGYIPFEDECKWYSHHDDMLLYSKRYPNVLFTLHGEGEESGDVWVTYYKNGKSQEEKAEIQLASFDERKLA